jgi:hypothetical protein
MKKVSKWREKEKNFGIKNKGFFIRRVHKTSKSYLFSWVHTWEGNIFRIEECIRFQSW